MNWSHAAEQRLSPEHIKRSGWREQNILVVSAEDQRLTWTGREFVRQLGTSFTARHKRRPIMDKWSVEAVEMRLEDAAQVIRRLPPVRVPGYFNTWPSMFVEFADLVGQEPLPMRLPPPSTAAITHMEETLDWLRWLEAEDVKLVWARADRKPWKAICCQLGISRATANRRYQYALSLIAWRLNGRAVPTKRSREFLIEKARRVSTQI